jgi:nucleotide-binding universal stress UspA family protein
MKLLRLKVVLAAIDYDDGSGVVLSAGRALAEAAGAKLHVVHVEQPAAVPQPARDQVEGAATDAALALLGRANVRLASAQIHVIDGDPAHVIRALADRIHADVIVLGPHREDQAGERRLGSTALAIATASWAPCLIVTRGIHLPLTRVLVPVDLSDTARGALVVALSWSSALRGGWTTSDQPRATGTTRLTALYVDEARQTVKRNPGLPQHLETELDRVRRTAGTWAGVVIEGVTLSSDDVARAIVDRAREDDSDLVVLGTRGLGLDAVGRLGSVSDAVIRRVEAPVLLVPPAAWSDARSD